MSQPAEMPARIRALYAEMDAARAVIEDPRSSARARDLAMRDLADIEAALTNHHA